TGRNFGGRRDVSCAAGFPVAREFAAPPAGFRQPRAPNAMASTAVQSSLQLYLRSINESPLLTADEEKQLARRIIHHSDMAARERMVRSNLRLVVNIAKHY